MNLAEVFAALVRRDSAGALAPEGCLKTAPDGPVLSPPRQWRGSGRGTLRARTLLCSDPAFLPSLPTWYEPGGQRCVITSRNCPPSDRHYTNSYAFIHGC